MKKLLWFGIFLISFGAGAKELSWSPDVYFSGSPSYVSEFATKFRDNGGPLSPFGSHIGLKADVKQKEFASTLHFACETGKFVYDYSRTGLAASSSIRFLQNGRLVKEANERRIVFEYYGWRERAKFTDFMAESNVEFLGLDQYLISARIQNNSDKPMTLAPVLYLEKKGRALAIQKTSTPELAVINFSVQPTVVSGENYLVVIPSLPGKLIMKGEKSGNLQIEARAITLAPKQIAEFWYVFGYHPDAAEKAIALARAAQKDFGSPLSAWDSMLKERDAFFASLPKPHLAQSQDDYYDLYLMAATALDNARYAPRGAMKYWGCVPTKVHYNWFWLWDSGFEALGYSEFKPKMATDVIDAIFQAQRKDGFIAHMEDERAEPITPHSQSPVFGFSGGKMIDRYYDDPDYKRFEKEMYEKGKLYIDWWKRARDENHNGLFEYISQDEGGWDNSTRMYYVPRGMFISYLGSVGEVIGSKVKPLDNVDLNPWMYLYYDAMADWADDLGKPEEAKKWRQDAKTLAGKIDEILWDPEVGTWLDTYNWKGSKRYHHFVTLTPAIWFPAFAGSTLDEKKARETIEKHLLNPKEFFGKYPMPIVAYNDKYFDDTKPGWTASIWVVTAYTAMEALWRFGYENEAQELRDRFLAMMADQGGMKGIYETYDPLTGSYKNKYSTGGYASFQFGWSSVFTMEMIMERYQEQRFVFAETKKIQGFIRRAEDFSTREAFYRIRTGLDAPKVELESADFNSLLQAKSVKIKLSDPYGALTAKTFKVWLKGKPFDLELNKDYLLKI